MKIGYTMYHNDLNMIPLRQLKEVEMDIFWAIVDRIKNEADKNIDIDFTDLKHWCNWKERRGTDKEFIGHLENLSRKMLGISIRYISEDYIDLMTIFTRFRIVIKDEILKIKMNEDFLHLFNDLIASKAYTSFLTKNIHKLNSGYSKEIFRRIMEFDGSTWRKYRIEDFREQLQIPEKYRMSDIDREILKKVEKDFKESGIFESFKIEKLYKAGRGRGGKVVSHLVFHFKLTGEGEVVEIKPKSTISLKELWLRDTYIPNQPNEIKNPEGLVKSIMKKYKDSTLEEMQTELSKNKPHVGKKTHQPRRIEIIPDWLFDGKSDDGKTRYINDLRLSGYTAEADKIQQHWDDSLMIESEDDDQDGVFKSSVSYEELLKELKNKKAT